MYVRAKNMIADASAVCTYTHACVCYATLNGYTHWASNWSCLGDGLVVWFKPLCWFLQHIWGLFPVCLLGQELSI